MVDEEISPEEQAEFKKLCTSVDAVLLGASQNMCLSVLASVTAHIAAEFDHPQDVALSFISEFIHYLDHKIEETPAETVIDIPEPN